MQPTLPRPVRVAVGAVVAVEVLSCACGASVSVAGSALPPEHEATVSARVEAPPIAVWATIVDFDGQERWRPELADVRATAAGFEEVDGWGQVAAYAVEERVERERLVIRVLGDGAFGGTWTVTLAPEEAGTRVTVTERGVITSSALRLVAWLFVDPAATARGWTEALAAAFPPAG